MKPNTETQATARPSSIAPCALLGRDCGGIHTAEAKEVDPLRPWASVPVWMAWFHEQPRIEAVRAETREKALFALLSSMGIEPWDRP